MIVSPTWQTGLMPCASRNKDAVICPPEAGYGHSIACIMATDSLWSGHKMVFDPKKRTIQAA